MTAAVTAALLACLAFAMAGPRLARALRPDTAVRLLVPAALLAAACGAFVLGTVTFTWLGQLREVAELGAWSPQRLHALDPIPPVAAAAAGALLVPLAGWTLVSVVRSGYALCAVRRAARRLGHRSGSPVVVLDSPVPDAFTLPGISAPIVLTTAILAALDADEQRILLAHEESHRRHRHLWWTLGADVAAAVNPLLRPTARAVRHATERWADEDAAATAGRRRVAVTIGRVALLRTGRPATVGVPAATGGRVPDRISALLRPAPRTRIAHVGVVAVLTVAILAGAVAVERSGEHLFERAGRPSAWHHPTATARRP